MYRLLLLLTLGLSSQVEAQSLLWKITGKNLKSPAWLYGTMHVQDPRVFELPEGWQEKLKTAGRLALEMDLSNPPDPMKIMSVMTAPPDSSLDKLLSTEDYEKLNLWFTDSMHMPLALLKQMKPFMLISMVQKKRMETDMPVALDAWLADQAKKMEVPVSGLETLEEQIAVIDMMPLQEQAQMLAEMIQNPGEQENQENEMMNAYLSGNLDKLLIMANRWETDPAFKAEIINRRNRIMAGRISEMFETGPVFTAVGALHLPGEEGIIQLLRKKGYIVEAELNPKE